MTMLSVTVPLLSVSDITETTEGLENISQAMNRLVLVLFFIAVIAVAVGIVYLIHFNKTVAKPVPTRRDPSKYKQTQGTITNIKKVEFTITQRDGTSENAHSVFDPNLKGDALRKNFEEITAAEKSKEIIKTRYEVGYEFTIPDRQEIYKGEFSIYQENDDIAVGKDVTVMYNPEKPFSNYTKYNSPIGRL